MKRYRFSRLFTALLLSLLIGVFFIPVHGTNLSDSGINVHRNGSIEAAVNYYPDGATFRLYKVADITDSMNYGYTDKFKDAAKGIDITVNSETGTTNADWMEAAEKLSAAIQRNGIAEDYKGTVSGRKVTFSNLPIGLYLLKGDDYKDDTISVTSQACLISIPNRLTTEDEWTYDVKMTVKVEDPTWPHKTPAPSPGTSPTPSSSPSPGTSPTPKTTPTPGTSPSPSVSPSPGTVTSTPEITGTPGTETTSPAENPSNPRNPNTGDSFRRNIYIGILVIDAAVLILYFVLRRKNRQQDDE